MKQNHSYLMLCASWASIGVALTLIFLKIGGFLLTGSIAILSTLFDSVQDLMTSSINFVAVKNAIQPADKKHRFGHGKAQGIGSLIQSMIILISGGILIYTSCQHLFQQKAPSDLSAGILILVIALVLTFILIQFQQYVIQRTHSLSIKADRAHYTGDILMNTGVILSLIASHFMKTGWLDALFGIGVGFYLIKVSYDIICQSIEMLMDTELSPEIRHKITHCVLILSDIHKVSDLRTRQSGNKIFIQMTLHMTNSLSLKQAHLLADQVEHLIHSDFPNAEIVLHLEPDQK